MAQSRRYCKSLTLRCLILAIIGCYAKVSNAETLPMRLVGGYHPVVSVEVKDVGTFDLLVDTGAEVTVLAQDAFEGLPEDYYPAKLRLGNINTPTQWVYILDSPFSSTRHQGYEGILGLNTLENYRVTFDYEAGELRLNEPVPPGTQWMDYEERDERATGRPFVLMSAANGTESWALLDTGAARTQLLSSELPHDAQFLHDSKGYNIDGPSGREEQWRVGSVTVGPAQSGPITVRTSSWAAVGGTFFREYITTFDFRNQRVGFAPVTKRGHIRPDMVERLGFQLDLADPPLIVYVAPGSTAEKAGLQAGDRIETIDGETTIHSGYFDLNAVFDDPGRPEYVIGLEDRNVPLRAYGWTGAAVVFENSYHLTAGWLWNAWLGSYYGDFFPWVYQPHLGWLYVLDGPGDSVWAWHGEHGWIWTSGQYYPAFYHAAGGRWEEVR